MLNHVKFYSESKIPELTMKEITEYIYNGRVPCKFLTAALENNLKQTYALADGNNLVAIPAIVHYFYNTCPGNAWGSPKIVQEWIEAGGLQGLQKAGARD